MTKEKILIIEDDLDAADVLEAYLRKEGYEVLLSTDGREGFKMVEQSQPDLVLLDVMLPGMNGTDVLAEIRKNWVTPVIMITAMGDAHDKIGALRYGADDYIVKPYDPSEVMARVHAVLRRSKRFEPAKNVMSWQNLEVDEINMTVKVKQYDNSSRQIDLTPTEFSLLVLLMRAKTRPLSRQHLLEECLPDSYALERVVDTHIYNLRKKLENAGMKNILINVRGIGYRFIQP
ncbi:DNA-binding response regulator [Candidatus Pantoea deserta]|uniref:DNA-binding response regulator n=1 Tax=Candidatus Pantoea deserta TaxID=1869313 RepID=A0A3N4P8V0_9GAMM|nr:response regulator transcription factor [Pantoea deserta]RPD95903.1 DNA-binding response regulator [Pantoea deserta]